MIKNGNISFSQMKMYQENFFFVVFSLCLFFFFFWQPHLSTVQPVLLSAVSCGFAHGPAQCGRRVSPGQFSAGEEILAAPLTFPRGGNAWFCCYHWVGEARQASIRDWHIPWVARVYEQKLSLPQWGRASSTQDRRVLEGASTGDRQLNTQYVMHLLLLPPKRYGMKVGEILQWKEITQLCPFWAQNSRAEEKRRKILENVANFPAQGKKLNKFLCFFLFWKACLENPLETRLCVPLFSCLCWVEPSLVCEVICAATLILHAFFFSCHLFIFFVTWTYWSTTLLWKATIFS